MKAAVIMGSASDEAKVEKGIAILKEYLHTVHIVH